jgi:hypothetical protein
VRYVDSPLDAQEKCRSCIDSGFESRNGFVHSALLNVRKQPCTVESNEVVFNVFRLVEQACEIGLRFGPPVFPEGSVVEAGVHFVRCVY